VSSSTDACGRRAVLRRLSWGGGVCRPRAALETVRRGQPGGAGDRARYPNAHCLLIGSDGIPLADFFARAPEAFLTR